MSRSPRSPLYRPFSQFQVRAPLLPIERYCALDAVPAAAHLSDGRIRAAVALASHSLIARLAAGTAKDEARRSADSKLLRYLIRASARPTPFGFFAGVAIGHWGSHSTLALSGDPPAIGVRADMEWLMHLVFELERRTEIRKALKIVANPATFSFAGRLSLDAFRQGVADSRVSVRATDVERMALALAGKPIRYGTLVEKLAAATDAPAKKAATLVDEMLDNTLLLTTLRPPLTGDNPIRHVIDTLKDIPAAREIADKLEQMDVSCRSWRHLRGDAIRLEELEGLARAVSPAATVAPLQADMAWPLKESTLSHAVGIEAVKAVELLLRFAPPPRASGPLETYRAKFLTAYGNGREVPLLELLDPNAGLGPPQTYSDQGMWSGAAAGGNMETRDQLLLALACEALRDAKRTVILDEKMLSTLQLWTPEPSAVAPTLDIYVSVLAASREAIDAGDFKVVIGPNTGAGAAGRNLARFSTLLGSSANEALSRMAKAAAAAAPDAIHAEIVYLPRKLHLANVAVRPPVHTHEIALGVAPGVAAQNVISPAELVVGVDAGRFYLRSPSRNARIVVTSTHMLNFRNAPILCSFLADASCDGLAGLQMFNWGPATLFPYLPRLETGRIVLAPAQWRITPASAQESGLSLQSRDGFSDAFASWRVRWNVPRHVYLSFGDHRLLLDLDKDIFVAELRQELRKLKAGGVVVLQEALPGPEDAWLEGPGGHYLSEFAVSVCRRDLAGAQDAERAMPTETPRSSAMPIIMPALRRQAPGSNWLYAKLYGGRELEDDLLAGPISDFLASLSHLDRGPPFFFLRYADPEPHLRFRFKGNPKQLLSEVLPRLCEWGQALIAEGRIRSLAFDTYDREIERYGGPSAMDIVEDIFMADSAFALDLLAAGFARNDAERRVQLAAASLDRLLLGLGVSENVHQWWRTRYADVRNEVSDEYRRVAKSVSALLASPNGAGAFAEALRLAQQRLAPLGSKLRGLETEGGLTCPLFAIVESLVHMHCNRLFGIDRKLERRAMGLLMRVYESQRARRLPGDSREDSI